MALLTFAASTSRLKDSSPIHRLVVCRYDCSRRTNKQRRKGRDVESNSTSFWDELYQTVIRDGEETSPRGRKTLEVMNAMYQALPDEHFDDRAGRNISLTYIFREFLWFIQGDRYDTRMTKYAKLWEQCVDLEGGINSNYGQYLFGEEPGFDGPIFHALDHIVGDRDSRRAHVSIFQRWHQEPQMFHSHDPLGQEENLLGIDDRGQAHYVHEYEHPEVPCTTGMGFRLKNDELLMNVHMRSQDLWHGAANDEAVCYLIQLVAVAYLQSHGVHCVAGPITHYIDSLHFYERHWKQAANTIGSVPRQEVQDVTKIASLGFTAADLNILRGTVKPTDQPSLLLRTVLDIPGDWGNDSGEFEFGPTLTVTAPIDELVEV